MPLTGGKYIQRTEDDIRTFLRSELRAEYGEDIDLTPGSVWETFSSALSRVDSEEVEPAIQEVFQSAYVTDATGDNLEKLVALVGITRRSAVNAAGVIQFSSNSTVSQDHTIQNGTVVQTDSNDPTEFETTELVKLQLFDDFEGGSLSSSYGGQTGDFSVVDGSAASDPSPTEGTYELKGDAVDGSKVYQTTDVTHIGCVMDFRTYLQNDTGTSAVAHNLFGVVNNNDYYRTVLDASGSHEIEKVIGGSPTSLVSSNTGPPEDEWVRNEIEWSSKKGGTIISRIYDSSGTLVDRIEVNGESTIEQGGFGFESGDGSENKYWDHTGMRSVTADARAREGGVEGNVGANTLIVTPSGLSGVDDVTNPWPMGDEDRYLTDLSQFTPGLPRETDDELRDRAQESPGALGRATVPALIANLTALEGAESVTVFENKTNTDNTPSGLPPKSFEVVFYGTTPDQDIAEAIFNTRAFTARDYSGTYGSSSSDTVKASNGQTFTEEWSTPTKVDIDMTLDIVVDSSYIGDDPLRDRIVSYVGGTRTNGTSALGTGAGEDVYVDQIEDVVTGPDDTGVIGISTYSFTPSTTTDANGLEVVDIGSNEVGETNGQDGSITLNVTQV